MHACGFSHAEEQLLCWTQHVHHNWHECWRHGPSQNTKINAHWQRPRLQTVHSESLHEKGEKSTECSGRRCSQKGSTAFNTITTETEKKRNARKQPTFVMGRDTTQQPADGKFMEHWNNARHAASHMAPLTFDTGGGGGGQKHSRSNTGCWTLRTHCRAQITNWRRNSRSCRMEGADRQVHSTCQSSSASPTAYQPDTRLTLLRLKSNGVTTGNKVRNQHWNGPCKDTECNRLHGVSCW